MTNKLIIRYILDPIRKRPEQHPKQTTSFMWVSSLPYGEQHCPFFRASAVICTSFVSRASLSVGGRGRGGRAVCCVWECGWRTWMCCCLNKGNVESKLCKAFGGAALLFCKPLPFQEFWLPPIKCPICQVFR